MTPPSTVQVPTLKAPKSGVTVRLYNPGFGDCLLLAFRASDGSPRYLLIDCGCHHQYTGGSDRLRKVAQNVGEATGYHLHAVAATHEHTDHLTGFKAAQDIFEKITIDDLWLAWTENSSDPLVSEVKNLVKSKKVALQAAITRLRAAMSPMADTLDEILGFEFDDGLAAASKLSPLPFLREHSKRKLVQSDDFLAPGKQAPVLPGVKGVRIFVLGPPRDLAKIKLLDKESEMYPQLTAMTGAEAFMAAVMAPAASGDLTKADQDALEALRPFDQNYTLNSASAFDDPDFGTFFREHYGQPGIEGNPESWRQIETDWLGSAADLALSINEYTNNTSLVLAIELTDSDPHKVLLFAADAQAGNWLSWEQVTFPKAGPNGADLPAHDLIRQTVLYKVGHHGSRNATMRSKGLELMTDPRLVALLPVDEAWAKQEPRNWDHPADRLYERLIDLTHGRILRSDRIPADSKPPQKPAQTPQTVWNDFIQNIDWDRSSDRLWIQFTVPG